MRLQESEVDDFRLYERLQLRYSQLREELRHAMMLPLVVILAAFVGRQV